MVSKGKVVEERLEEVALIEIDKLEHGGAEEKEREKVADIESTVFNMQAIKLNDLQ